MKKVLVFLLACFTCAAMYAQPKAGEHWQMVSQGCLGTNCWVKCNLYIDGEIVANPNLEIGVFDQDEICRGAKKPVYVPMYDWYYYQLTCKGYEGCEYHFRIWDHENDCERTDLTLDIPETIVYVSMVSYGGPTDPYHLNFASSGAAETYTLPITPYSGDNDHYYLISSPIGDVDVDAVENLTSNSFDLYYFNQSGAGNETYQYLEWINYNQGEGEDPGFTQLLQGKGYLYANSGDDTGDDVVLTFTGTAPVPGDEGYTIPLDYDEAALSPGQNLIGNPFAEEIGINREFYIMNADGTELELAERDYLNPMEGAFVVATEPEQTVILGGAGGSGFNGGGSFKLRVNADRGCGDLAIVRFGQGQGLPKIMLNPEHTHVCFPMSDADYAVVYADNMGEMPVNFKAEKNGSYTLSFSSDNVDFGYLHLIDNMNGNDVDLLANPSYTFDARTTDYASRFKLVFATGNANDSFAFFSNGSFIISNDGLATLQVVDVNGRILKNQTINGCASVNVNAAPGVYMIRLINGDNVKVQKVVVK